MSSPSNVGAVTNAAGQLCNVIEWTNVQGVTWYWVVPEACTTFNPTLPDFAKGGVTTIQVTRFRRSRACCRPRSQCLRSTAAQNPVICCPR
jgi:hypothetical protein